MAVWDNTILHSQCAFVFTALKDSDITQPLEYKVSIMAVTPMSFKSFSVGWLGFFVLLGEKPIFGWFG